MGRKTTEAISLSIGELSKRTGCHIETIRYYEREGILPAPPRTAAGHRVYADKHLKCLTFVRRCRALGFSLSGIRMLLSLGENETDSCSKVREYALVQVAEIRRKIETLNQMEKALSSMADQCTGGSYCPIIDMLSTPEGDRQAVR